MWRYHPLLDHSYAKHAIPLKTSEDDAQTGNETYQYSERENHSFMVARTKEDHKSCINHVKIENDDEGRSIEAEAKVENGTLVDTNDFDLENQDWNRDVLDTENSEADGCIDIGETRDDIIVKVENVLYDDVCDIVENIEPERLTSTGSTHLDEHNTEKIINIYFVPVPNEACDTDNSECNTGRKEGVTCDIYENERDNEKNIRNGEDGENEVNTSTVEKCNETEESIIMVLENKDWFRDMRYEENNENVQSLRDHTSLGDHFQEENCEDTDESVLENKDWLRDVHIEENNEGDWSLGDTSLGDKVKEENCQDTDESMQCEETIEDDGCIAKSGLNNEETHVYENCGEKEMGAFVIKKENILENQDWFRDPNNAESIEEDRFLGVTSEEDNVKEENVVYNNYGEMQMDCHISMTYKNILENENCYTCEKERGENNCQH